MMGWGWAGGRWAERERGEIVCSILDNDDILVKTHLRANVRAAAEHGRLGRVGRDGQEGVDGEQLERRSQVVGAVAEEEGDVAAGVGGNVRQGDVKGGEGSGFGAVGV